VSAIAVGIDERVHRVLRSGARDELAVPAPPWCMTRHPDIGREAAEHEDAALAVCPLFWIPRGCQHSEVTGAYDVQHAVTVADGKRPRGASARAAAGDVRGERDRPHTDRI